MAKGEGNVIAQNKKPATTIPLSIQWRRGWS